MGGKWVHKLIEVFPGSRTAVCAKCGPVSIRRMNSGWRCNTGNPREGSGKRKRYQYRACLKPACERCGFVPEHVCQMDVHHIDGNKQNNHPDNCKTYCANCHRLIEHERRQ